MKRSIIIVLSLMLLASFTIFAKGETPKKEVIPKEVVEKGKYNEAPMLAERVAAGELPPVDKRLPKEPMVIEPLEEIGQYGGTAYIAIHKPLFTAGNPQSIIGPEGLFRFKKQADGTYKVVPNIASYEMSSDGKTFTIFLRKGIKWSDGMPFTADDIFFHFNDIVMNKELNPTVPGRWMVGGEPAKMEKLDDYTIRIQYTAPNPTIIESLTSSYSGGCGIRRSFMPAHYMKQFHPKYTSKEKLDKLCKDGEFEHWWQLFKHKGSTGSGGITHYVGMPTINAFMITKEAPEGSEYERNPYYWKVDTAGNQLPYIDKVSIAVVTNKEALDLKIISGELDLELWTITLDNYTLYKQNEEAGNYRVLLFSGDVGAIYTFFNLTSKDPILRKIFQNVKFRRAMSLAINREELNKIIFSGRGEPRAMTMLPNSVFYEEEFAKAYADYDVDKSNALLDEIGLTKRDSEGFRLRPDGKTLEIIFEFQGNRPAVVSTVELLKEYWGEVGVKIFIKEEARSLLSERVSTNDVNIGIWYGEGCVDPLFVAQAFYFWAPTNASESLFWGHEWTIWRNTNGEKGEEPPEYIKELFRLCDEIMVTTDEKERVRLGKELLRSNAENCWTIGTVGNFPFPVIVRKNLRNFPEKGLLSYGYLRGVLWWPEQFFFKQD